MNEWSKAVSRMEKLILKISTPDGSGTGFLLSLSEDASFCAVATAAHVVSHAHDWQEPIRLTHHKSEETLLLKDAKRSIHIDEEIDTAAIVFKPENLPFKEPPLPLIPEGKVLDIGDRIGWLGFPALSPNRMCFFTGRISTCLDKKRGYLVDGVAINGVSGGPAFFCAEDDSIQVIGVMTAYIPNRATGELLPGLCLVSNVTQLQLAARAFEQAEKLMDKDALADNLGE